MNFIIMGFKIIDIFKLLKETQKKNKDFFFFLQFYFHKKCKYKQQHFLIQLTLILIFHLILVFILIFY